MGMSDVDIMLREARMEERGHVLNAVATWVELARREGYADKFNGFPSRADIEHSALLQRLLEGKDPLPIPPPKAYSYPWYDLIEAESGRAIEVWEPKAEFADYLYPVLMVEQYPWKIEHKLGDTEYIISYHEDGQKFLIERDGEMTHDRYHWTLRMM